MSSAAEKSAKKVALIYSQAKGDERDIYDMYDAWQSEPEYIGELLEAELLDNRRDMIRLEEQLTRNIESKRSQQAAINGLEHTAMVRKNLDAVVTIIHDEMKQRDIDAAMTTAEIAMARAEKAEEVAGSLEGRADTLQKQVQVLAAKMPAKERTPTAPGAGRGATDSEPDPSFVAASTSTPASTTTPPIEQAIAQGLDPTTWPEVTELDKYLITQLAASVITGLTGINPYTVFLGTQVAAKLVKYTSPIIHRLARSENSAANTIGIGLLSTMNQLANVPEALRGLGGSLTQAAATRLINQPVAVQYGALGAAGVGLAALSYGFVTQVVMPLAKWLTTRDAEVVLGKETVATAKKDISTTVRAMNNLKNSPMNQATAAQISIGQASGTLRAQRKVRKNRALDVVSPFGDSILTDGYSIIGYSTTR